MSVRKRYKNNGTYVWEFCITVQKEPRKQYRKGGFKTKIEAQNAENEAIAKYKNKKIKLNPKKTRFKNVLELFFEHIEKSNDYQEGTISNYKGYYNNHLQDFYYLGIEEITPFVIQNWLDNASKSKSPYVINGCRKLCKAAFNYALKQKYICENPFEYMQHTAEPVVLRNRFDIDEIKNIVAVCLEKFPDFFCIFCLAIFTGMRLGEYSALSLDSIDFKKNQIWITRQYTRRKIKERTKTITSKRIVDFSQFMASVLKWHIRKYRIFSGYLFRGRFEGKPVSANWVNETFDKLLEACGYPNNYMRVHDLRGQYVDISHTSGLPAVYISRQVGHARTSTTNDVYTSILSDLQSDAKNIFDEIFCEHFVNILQKEGRN